MKALPLIRTVLAVVICASLCSKSILPQDARTLIARAMAESNQEKQVQLLCQAADLEPANKQYRSDCNASKAAMIASDKQALKTAQDASDAGQGSKARRYAKYVSSFDPDLHRQAEQLLAKLDGSPGAGTAGNADAQRALLVQADAAYQTGNLQAAKTAAQGITDPSVKPAATQMLNDIERYNGLVSTGGQQEKAKEFADAEHSYQAALAINPHVASDDLAGKVLRVRNLSAASAVTQSSASGNKNNVRLPTSPDTKNQRLVVEVSPEEKKKRLLDEGTSAMSRNDLDTAGRKFKQVLDLDSSNEDAKQGIIQITAALNKDPARLEKTLREAIVAFYGSHFEDAESRLNRYLGADGGKKKGAAYFYLGATEATLALLDDAPKRDVRTKQAQADFKQARDAGYQPLDAYVSARILGVWKSSGM